MNIRNIYTPVLGVSQYSPTCATDDQIFAVIVGKFSTYFPETLRKLYFLVQDTANELEQ